MKIKTPFMALLCVFLFIPVSAWGEIQIDNISQDPQGPVAYLPLNHIRFAPVLEGESVTQTFPIQNNGTKPLKIENIRTGCGCAVATYPKIGIPPGGKGDVIVEINTFGYGGKTMTKRATMYTNDKTHPTLVVQISGKVEEFAHLTPKAVGLKGGAGEEISSTVSIVPNSKYPFKISNVKMEKGQNIETSLKEVKNKDHIEYRLTIINTKQQQGRYFDYVTLMTDNKIRPEIKIRVYGDILGNQVVEDKKKS